MTEGHPAGPGRTNTGRSRWRRRLRWNGRAQRISESRPAGPMEMWRGESENVVYSNAVREAVFGSGETWKGKIGPAM